MVLARSSDEDHTPGLGRVLDRDWVDLDTVKRWKSECTDGHDKCRNPHRVAHVSPAWLIDTLLGCLVPGIGVPEYVALSYRWGASIGFRATNRLLELLRRPGALSQSAFADDIPPSVQHAMQLVLAIDERYLWVDAMCIMQDDDVHMAEQLQLMGAIYASAKMTIVAGDGDAMDGISGLKGISGSRELDQTVLPIFDNEKIIAPKYPILQNEDGCSPYFKRGWTYQEYFLSRRRLIFAEGQAYWECACVFQSEDLHRFEDKKRGTWLRDIDFSNIIAGRPDFETLGELLAEYNYRELTYPEDAFAAITGFLSILSRSFEGGFLFGLPEMCFDSALMWRGRYSPLVRRRPSRKPHPLYPAPDLPSWSWMAWRSYNMVIMAEAPYTFGDSTYGRHQTTPITQWYTHDAPE